MSDKAYSSSSRLPADAWSAAQEVCHEPSTSIWQPVELGIAFDPQPEAELSVDKPAGRSWTPFHISLPPATTIAPLALRGLLCFSEHGRGVRW
jgi:hypothetical protein